MPDNAVIGAPVTAAPSEAPPEDTEVSLLPETESDQAAPETEGDDDTPDSGEHEGSEWEGLSPAEISAKVAEQVEAARKDVEARKDESFRRQLDNQRQQERMEQANATATQARERAVQVRNGAAYNGLMRGIAPAIKEAFDAGKEAPDPARVVQALNIAAQQVADATATEVFDTFRTSWTPAMQEIFGQDFHTKLDPANAAALQHSLDTRDMRAFARHVVAAADHLSSTKTRTTAEAEAAAKLAAETKPKAISPRQPSPTRAGAPAGRGKAADVLASARPGSPEYMRAYKEKYGL